MTDERGPLIRTEVGYGATAGPPLAELPPTRTSASKWGHFKHEHREFFAEFLGTFLFLVIGLGANAQTSLTEHGNWIGLSLGWGLGLLLGVFVSGGVSGGHLNPAVTATKWVFRRFPAYKVPIYILAQLLGAFAAAAVVYLNYETTITAIDGGVRSVTGTNATAGIFASYPAGVLSAPGAFLSEGLGTFLLVLAILSITDHRHNPNNALAPLAIGLALSAIGLSHGHLTGFSLNPARDLGPRLFTLAAGYGTETFTTADFYFWIPIVAPFVGGLAAGFIYDGLVYTGISPLN